MENDNNNNVTEQLTEGLAGLEQTWQNGELGDELSEQIEPENGAKRWLNRNSMALLVVCAIAVAAVCFSRSPNNPKTASAAQQALEQKVDLALAKLIGQQATPGKMLQNTEKLVSAFNEFPAKQQVASDALQIDPFWVAVHEDTQIGEAPVVDDRPKKYALLLRQWEQKLSNLTLQSLLANMDQPKCQINGEIFSIGDVVDEVFEVAAIMPDHVVLRTGGKDFILEI